MYSPDPRLLRRMSVGITAAAITILFTITCAYDISAGREEQFRRSVATLRQEIVRANSLAREASSMAQELRRSTSYSVTLQIPPENLGPNRRVRSETESLSDGYRRV